MEDVVNIFMTFTNKYSMELREYLVMCSSCLEASVWFILVISIQ